MCQASNTMIFRDIIDFLLHIIDPFFVYSNDKELQELLKFLGYPYELHSHFFSGALHYWPHLIALMNWVVYFIKTYTKEEEFDIFSNYHLDSYDLFMKGKSTEQRFQEFQIEVDLLLEKNKNEYEEIKEKIKEIKLNKKEMKKNIIGEIDEKIIEKQKEVDEEIHGMAKIEEETAQLKAKFNSYYEIINQLFNGKLPDVEELKEAVMEDENINDEIYKIRKEISEIQANDNILRDNFKTSEELLDEFNQESEIQSEIDDLRRNSAYLMEELELIEEEMLKTSQNIEEKNIKSEKQQLKARKKIEYEHGLIFSHTEIFRSLITELSLINK